MNLMTMRAFRDEMVKICEDQSTPFAGDIEQMTEENEYFRRVLYTGKHSQLVVMSLKVGEGLPEEVHPSIDQFFRVEEGEADFILEGKSHRLEAGGAVVIPAGMRHEIVNASDSDPLKVYTVYSPPNHPAGTLDNTKEDAEAREKGVSLRKTANGDEEGSPSSPTSTDEPGESKEEKEEEEAAADPNKKVPKDMLLNFFRTHKRPVDDQVHELAEAHGASPHTMETQIYGILSDLLRGKQQ